MVVAACALNLKSQEELADIDAGFFGRDLAADEVEVRDTFKVMAALADEHLPNHLVIRHVLSNLIAEPTGVGTASLLTGLIVSCAEHVRETHRPEIGTLGPFQQLIDNSRPFCRI